LELEASGILPDRIRFPNSEDHHILVFVNDNRTGEQLYDFLFMEGFLVASISGGRSMRMKEEALKIFRSYGYPGIMVVTTEALKDLDIPNVKNVINFDFPTNIEKYVERINYTGRMGRMGLTTSFFNEKDKNLVEDLCQHLRENDQEMPSWLKSLDNE